MSVASLQCADEQNARERAQQLVDANDIELWKLDGRIAVCLKPPQAELRTWQDRQDRGALQTNETCVKVQRASHPRLRFITDHRRGIAGEDARHGLQVADVAIDRAEEREDDS